MPTKRSYLCDTKSLSITEISRGFAAVLHRATPMIEFSLKPCPARKQACSPLWLKTTTQGCFLNASRPWVDCGGSPLHIGKPDHVGCFAPARACPDVADPCICFPVGHIYSLADKTASRLFAVSVKEGTGIC